MAKDSLSHPASNGLTLLYRFSVIKEEQIQKKIIPQISNPRKIAAESQTQPPTCRSRPHRFLLIDEIAAASPDYNLRRRAYSLQQQHMKKREILNIDYKQDQGVLLGWNYNDLSKNGRFYRHVLLLYTRQLQIARQFVRNYVKRIKPGDFYYTIFLNQDQVLCQRGWQEKMSRNEFDSEKYLRAEMVDKKAELMMERVQQECESFNEPIVFNVLVQEAEAAKYFEDAILAKRRQNHFEFVCSLYGPFLKNEISVSQGVNHFSTLLEPLNRLTNCLHQFINQIAILHASLTITCNNGIIMSQNQESWQNESFNCVVRHYYGPSAAYKLDVLRFLNCNLAESGSYQLTIRLEFFCFDGGRYDTKKKLVVNFNKNCTHNLTMMPNRMGKPVKYESGIELVSNPYCSQTTICFNKIDDAKGLL